MHMNLLTSKMSQSEEEDWTAVKRVDDGKGNESVGLRCINGNK